MGAVALGILASLLSAANALVIGRSGVEGSQVLWLLLAQYVVGLVFAAPKRQPVAPLRLHFARLLCGLWAFGGYYLALAQRGGSLVEVSLLLNLAPLLATLVNTRSGSARLGAVLSFVGLILLLSRDGWPISSASARVLAMSASFAYALSITLLGYFPRFGESPRTTAGLYNLAGALCVVGAIAWLRPPMPPTWSAVVLVGALSAIRLLILTTLATDPAQSARISVLSNLAFVWLAIQEQFVASTWDLMRWTAMAVVIAGCAIANRFKAVD
jgi:drug/metabolite transporter (DMT)-like permease